MSEILNKIGSSFKASLRGEESINTLIYRWGLIGWIVAYFIANKLIRMIDFRFTDVLISIVAAGYFIWHIYVLRKCSPKKPKLSKEEKLKLREDARKDFNKKVVRKLLLQESIKKWDPIVVAMVIDAFCMAHFLGYVF